MCIFRKDRRCGASVIQINSSRKSCVRVGNMCRCEIFDGGLMDGCICLTRGRGVF